MNDAKWVNVLKIVSPFLLAVGAIIVLLTTMRVIQSTALIIVGCFFSIAGAFCSSVQVGLARKLAKNAPAEAQEQKK